MGRSGAGGPIAFASTTALGLTVMPNLCIFATTAISLVCRGLSAGVPSDFPFPRGSQKVGVSSCASNCGADGGRRVSVGGSRDVHSITRSVFDSVCGSISSANFSLSAGCLTANLKVAITRTTKAVRVTVMGG